VRSYWSPGTARYVVRHPSSVVALARAGWRLRRARWWRHVPFLPLPDSRYWDFRMATAYGDAGARPTPQALVEAARWSLRQPVST